MAYFIGYYQTLDFASIAILKQNPGTLSMSTLYRWHRRAMGNLGEFLIGGLISKLNTAKVRVFNQSEKHQATANILNTE